MAFIRTAEARVASPLVNRDQWNLVRQRSNSADLKIASSPNLEKFDPERFLLTHATIVASVDVDEVPGAKIGSKIAFDDGATINRKWGSYHIKPDCSQFVNNNGDSWERSLLAATYRTFVGAENYQEHIQIPELSKGKIIDAVARDIGDSLYIDILVATDRKHTKLVRDIESGEMNALSMGAQVAYTICTKCGNVAADEADLCRHIKYEKGNFFIDDSGQRRIIAELCGHVSDPESNIFIEASWVKNPAFRGAVLRNILEPAEALGHAEKVVAAHEMPSRQIDLTKMQKAAGMVPEGFLPLKEALATVGYMTLTGQFDFGGPQDQGGQGGEQEAPADPLKKIVDEVKDKALDKVKTQLKGLVDEEGEIKDKATTPMSDVTTDDSLVHSFDLRAKKIGLSEDRAVRIRKAILALHQKDWTAVRHAKCSPSEMLVAINFWDRGKEHYARTDDLQRISLKVGSTRKYDSADQFLRACQTELGRKLSTLEAGTLIVRGHLLSLAEPGLKPISTTARTSQ
jgi:hypothetical protein